MKLLDMAPAEIEDQDIRELLAELNDLRQGHIAVVRDGNLLVYLHAFYLPDGKDQFVPIGKANLSIEYWLLAKWDQLSESPVRRLCNELLCHAGIQADNAIGQRIYKVLNACMRALHRKAQKKRKRR